MPLPYLVPAGRRQGRHVVLPAPVTVPAGSSGSPLAHSGSLGSAGELAGTGHDRCRAALPSSLSPRCQHHANRGGYQHPYNSVCEQADLQGAPTTYLSIKLEVELQVNVQESLPFATHLEPAHPPPEAGGHFNTHSSSGRPSFVCPLVAVVKNWFWFCQKLILFS